MIKIEARTASNSRAIAKFRNTEINYFAPKMVDHDLIRGSLASQILILRIKQGFAIQFRRYHFAEYLDFYLPAFTRQINR